MAPRRGRRLCRFVHPADDGAADRHASGGGLRDLGACGTAATAVLAAAIYGDPFTWPVVLGIGLIIAGVLLVELGSQRAAADKS
ncbi:drug/metabolite transporter (DMT)-like permease [Mycobacterium sp. OAE908]